MAAHVYSDDCFGTWSNGGFGKVGVDAKSFAGYVDGYGHRARVEDGAGRGHKSVIGDDDFIAGTNADGRHGHFEGGSSIGDGEAVFGAMEIREFLLKSEGAGTRGSPPNTAVEHVLQGFALRIVILGPNGKRLSFGLATTEQCEFRHVYLLTLYWKRLKLIEAGGESKSLDKVAVFAKPVARAIQLLLSQSPWHPNPADTYSRRVQIG